MVPYRGTQIYTTAQIIMQVRVDDPQSELHEDYRTAKTLSGEVYPDDRHFLVTTNVREEICYP